MKRSLAKMRSFITLRRAAIVVAPLLIVGTLLSQARPGGTPADEALRALNQGRYQDVEQVLSGQTDARSIALRGRALIEVGRYADAEKLLAGPAKAQATSDAALEFGLLQLIVGRRTEAAQTLRRVLSLTPRTAADNFRLARAAVALGRETAETETVHDANRFFREANRLAPDDPIINAEWGLLFLEKYYPDDALKSFQVALKSDETNVTARVGLANLLAEQNPPTAKSAIEQALKVNPNYIPAHLFVAESALDDRRLDDARQSIDAALKVNPNSLEARSLQAAMVLIRGDDGEFERLAGEILKINPTYGDVYRTAGDHLARQYRFDEAVVMTRRALTLDPRSARTLADLGLQLMRTGDEAAARKALEASFENDKFQSNLLTKNLLEVLDELEKEFETITDGRIVMKLHKSEIGVMREHALPLAKEALAALEKHYNFTAEGPLLVEMFPKHDGFAVRTLGLPGLIGALGACFGRVVTLDSRRARPGHPFSWQATRWQEMAHVITLQMSNQRIPRWLTEGISEYEEGQAGRGWGREMEIPFARALGRGKTLKLADLNSGFTRPDTIAIAYFQASLLVDHIVRTYGDAKLQALVQAYGQGLEGDAAVEKTIGVTLPDLQASFDQALDARFGSVRTALRAIPGATAAAGARGEGLARPAAIDLAGLRLTAAAHPGNYEAQLAYGQALAAAGDRAAFEPLEKAAALVPGATGEHSPHAIMGRLAEQLGDTERAMTEFRAALVKDHTTVEVARRLAALAEKSSKPQLLLQAYDRIVAIDPFDPVAHTGLGR